MSRDKLEFSKKEKLKMFKRAGGPENLICEECGFPIKGKPFDYDHTVEIWEMPSELRKKFMKEGVPAEYGKLLGYCCHKPKTKRKSAERAHGNRIIEKNAKAGKRKSRPIIGSKDSGWKRKMDGTVIRRD